MITETIQWWDDIYPESYKLILHAYGLKLKKAIKLDNYTTEITFKSPATKAYKRFMEDFEEGAFELLDEISRECETDDDYIERLEKEIKAIA